MCLRIIAFLISTAQPMPIPERRVLDMPPVVVAVPIYQPPFQQPVKRRKLFTIGE